ncbi:hypothetical protein ACFLZF_00590 [Nanoarchaeota archaeon]
MKNKIFALLFILILIKLGSAQCFPDYQCGVWSSCNEEGISIQTCTDIKCDQKNIINRKYCDKLDCKPNIDCGEWGSCNYFDKINDILKKELKFKGSKKRFCFDKNGCIEDFIEEEGCSLSIPIKVEKTKWCEQELVEIFDSNDNLMARLQEKDLTKNYKKIDISLIEKGLPNYCSYCFDGEKNYDEEDIDCGGASCPECIQKIDFINWGFFIPFFLWGIFILLNLIGLIFLSQNKYFSQNLKTFLKFFSPLNKKEALERERKIREFIFPKKISSKGFKNY